MYYWDEAMTTRPRAPYSNTYGHVTEQGHIATEKCKIFIHLLNRGCVKKSSLCVKLFLELLSSKATSTCMPNSLRDSQNRLTYQSS